MQHSHLRIAATLIASLASVATASAQSIPTKSPSCAQRMRVTPVENGNGVFFDETCSVAYVLPPIRGSATIDSIAGMTTLSQCDEIDDLNTSIQSLTARLKAITSRLNRRPVPIGNGPGGNGGPFGERAPSAPVPDTDPLSPSMREELHHLTEDLRSLAALRDTYRAVPAASAHFVYELKMNELVERYQRANPHLKFTPFPISRAYLSFVRKDANSEADASAVLNMIVPGLGRLPDAPEPVFLDPDRQHEVPPTDLATARIMGGSLSGGMTLSLFGACPYYDKAKKRMPAKLSDSDLRAHLVANVQYAYALQVFRRYRAEYRLDLLVSKLLEHTTKGGFLSSRVVTSFVENSSSNDWFTFTSLSDDPRFSSPYEVQEIKAQLIDRVLQNIAFAKVGGPVPSGDVGQPKPTGAAVASQRLRQCSHFYCQAGAFILDVVNATFGSSSAVNRFISENRGLGVEEVNERKMLEYYGSAGFVGNM